MDQEDELALTLLDQKTALAFEVNTTAIMRKITRYTRFITSPGRRGSGNLGLQAGVVDTDIYPFVAYVSLYLRSI
jgi:hypothetical protein